MTRIVDVVQSMPVMQTQDEIAASTFAWGYRPKIATQAGTNTSSRGCSSTSPVVVQ